MKKCSAKRGGNNKPIDKLPNLAYLNLKTPTLAEELVDGATLMTLAFVSSS